jgi:hypothetical protein
VSGMNEEDYSAWPRRDRLELLAFDARLAGVPQALLEALWQVIESLGSVGAVGPRLSHPSRSPIRSAMVWFQSFPSAP